MSGEFEVDGSQVLRESLTPYLIIGGVTLKLTMASIRAARVVASILIARHKRKEELLAFTEKHGANMGFLEIDTENQATLIVLEDMMRDFGISFSRLPDLHTGDDKTQYLYNLDDLNKLDDLIHNVEQERLGKLSQIKSLRDSDPEAYQAEKKMIEKENPSISVITAEGYAHTSLKDGRDTFEFTTLEASAEKELKKIGQETSKATDEEVRKLFDRISPGRKDPTENVIKMPSIGTPVRRRIR